MESPAARALPVYLADHAFFVKLGWGVASVIVFGFAQNALLGRVDIARVPPWVHLHGAVMLSWLGLLLTQTRLAARGKLARHRQLGWIGAALALVIPVLGTYTTVMALTHHRTPPFFTAPFFLALDLVNSLMFAGLVGAGIVRRRDTESHRRLIIGGTIVLLDPALDRLLPLPLTGGEPGVWLILLCQLGIVAIMAWHDRTVRGAVAPATKAVAVTLIAGHIVMSALARSPAMFALSAMLTGSPTS